MAKREWRKLVEVDYEPTSFTKEQGEMAVMKVLNKRGCWNCLFFEQFLRSSGEAMSVGVCGYEPKLPASVARFSKKMIGRTQGSDCKCWRRKG